MKDIWIHCPHCKKTSKLYLTSRPFLMVLKCPVCRKTLLNSEGKTYAIDNTKMIRMKGKPIQSFVEGLKHQLPRHIPTRDYTIDHQTANTTGDLKARASHKMGEPVMTAPVSRDDLLNLKIALESCQDVSDFLEKM